MNTLQTPPQEQDKNHAIPSDFQRNVAWSALSGISLVILIGLVCTLIWGFGRIFSYLEPVLLPIIIAGVIAYILNPIVEWIQRRGVRRSWATIFVVSAACLSVLGFGAAIVPPLVAQTNQLIENRTAIWEQATHAAEDLAQQPGVSQAINVIYAKTVKDARTDPLMTEEEFKRISEAATPTDQLAIVLDQNSASLIDAVAQWLTAGGRAIFGLTATIIGLVMIPIYLFYFLKEGDAISSKWHTYLPLRRSRFQFECVETLNEVNSYLISFVRGQMLVSLIDAILLAIALKIMGLPYAITIAAAAAVLGIIPYLGPVLTALPARIIPGVEWQSWGSVAVVGAIFVGVSQLDGWIIQPRVVGNTVGLHPLTVMFSVLFWSLVLGGIVGALIAIPLTAAIKVIFQRYVWKSFRRPAQT